MSVAASPTAAARPVAAAEYFVDRLLANVNGDPRANAAGI